MSNPFDKSLYANAQFGMGSAYRRKKEQDALDEQLRQFDLTRSDALDANAYESEADPDYLQALLGGLTAGAGAVTSALNPALGAIVGAPLISTGAGMVGTGLGRKKMVNRRTGKSYNV